MPPRGAQKQAAAEKEQTIIRFKVDGQLFVLNVKRVTPALDRELFNQSGLTLSKCGDNPESLFSIAAFMFLASRQRGQKVHYLQLEKTLTYDSEVEFLDDDEEVDEGPKAPE